MAASAVETICRMYDTWNDEGVEALRSHCTPDVVWHDDPQLPGASTSEGIEAVVARFQDFLDVIGHFQIDVREVDELQDGRHYSIVSVRVRGEGSGAIVADDHVHVMRVDDDLVAELWQYVDAHSARRHLDLPPG